MRKEKMIYKLKRFRLKILLIVIFLFSALLYQSCTAEFVGSDQLILKDGFTCNVADSMPYTGLCRDFYDNGEIKLEKNYKAGVLHGSFVRYYKNGQVNIEMEYKEGSPIYGFKQYYKSGKLKAEKIYQGNKQTLTRWFEEGQKSALINFENNMLHGKFQQWYKNGVKEMEGSYKYDKHDGLFTAWFSNGQMKIQGNYIEDKLDGKWTQWNELGIETANEYWIDGQKDSIWVYYFDNGRKRLETVYRDKLVKRNTEWNENGDVISNFESE